MAFLAPLFLAGLAAIALPVLLHLRKNRPKETIAFSSLMFLEASPPTTKRRSRLQDIVLLILRCLALALLILAFARPFFPSKDETATASDGSAMHFVLLDTSASMRGEPLEKAISKAREVIEGIPEDDWIALGGFSDQLRMLLAPERAREIVKDERKTTALSLLDEVKAGWNATRLDNALLSVVAAAGEETPLKIQVIGDLQKGAALDRLRNEAWPDQLQVVLHPIAAKEGWTNAGIRILPAEKETQRARVTNSEGSSRSDFTLTWSGTAEKTNVSIPPGESAIFEAPAGAPPEGKVALTGDDFDFDNEARWTTPTRPVAKIWYPDPTAVTDTAEVAYFLHRAMQATRDYSVEILSEAPAEAPALAVTSGLLEEEATASLKDRIEAGGNALFTVRDAASVKTISKILGLTAGEATEAKVADHARLGEINFKSGVFAPFADARYSDFSGIRFWKYRVLPTELAAKGEVLARFDSGDPAWLSYAVGKGTLHVLTTTWRPADSQLALTTKFAPLLHSLLGIPDHERGIHLVGHDGIEAPGLHEAGDLKFVVQLDPAESELTPLPEAEFRSLGLPLDAPVITAETKALTAARSNAEQESRQRIGWWLLAAAALFFLAETAWSGLAGARQIPVTS